MSYSSLQSEFNGTISKSTSEQVINANQGLAAELDNDGLKSEQVFQIMSLFKELSEAVGSDLKSYSAARAQVQTKAEELFANDKATAKNRRDSEVASAEKSQSNKLADLARIENDLNRSISEATNSLEESNANYESLGWFDKKRNEKSYQAEQAKFQAAIEQCRVQITELENAKQTARDYCKKQVEEIESAHAKRVAEMQTECQATIEECNKVEKERRETTLRNAKQFLDQLISANQLEQYANTIESIRPKYDDYQPISSESFSEPGDFFLGYARWRDFDNQLLDSLDCKYIGHSEKTSLVSLPFSIDLAQGMQVLVRPTGSNDAFWDNDCVRALTLRLIMSYPPGKLQLTLIDSFKNGISFSGIPDIVDKHHESIISGGVLTEAEYIAQALKSLRTKMGNYSGDQGYGRDKASYFEREPIQAVIINDFPNGFSNESLADLARLMENGSAFGMAFVIGMNPTYEDDFANNANYKAILSRAEVITAQGDNPLSLQYNDTPFELLFGDEDAVIENSDDIIGAMREGVVTSRARKEHFSQLFKNPSDWQDENAWRRLDSTNGVVIPLGVSGASKITQINVGMPGANTMHHGLITGPTGAGKSTALHTMVMSILLNYSPDEVQLVLIDFKEGTEFRSYAPYRIPNFRSITTTTEPEFALAALEDVRDLYETRTTIMTDLIDYRSSNGAAIPQVLVFFDEVQALFSDAVREDIKNRCLEILTLLVTKGRAMGIHVFLASQSFERVSAIQPLMSDMKIRLCLKDTDTGGILQDATALRDAPAGSAILNNQGGAADKNDLFQVCMLEDEERDELLNKLAEVYAAPGMGERYKSFDPRLLFTNIEDDFHHPVNTFIETGETPEAHATDPILRVGSLLKVEGNNTPYKETGRPFNIPLECENLLLIGDNSGVAKSLFIFSILSIGLDGLSRKAAHQDEVILFDFTEGGLYSSTSNDDFSGDATLESVYQAFPKLVKHIPTTGGARRSRRSQGANEASGKPPLEQEIDGIYQELQSRKQQCADSSDPDSISFSRVFIMAFAINSALRLANADSQEGGMYGELSSLSKLQTILDEGPMYDIYSIFWGQSFSATDKIINFNSARSTDSYFKNRVVFSASDQDFQTLAACVNRPATGNGSAFCNVDNNERIYFRPFDVPKLGWIEDFRSRFEERSEL